MLEKEIENQIEALKQSIESLDAETHAKKRGVEKQPF